MASPLSQSFLQTISLGFSERYSFADCAILLPSSPDQCRDKMSTAQRPLSTHDASLEQLNDILLSHCAGANIR
jgi:hypothetical protein